MLKPLGIAYIVSLFASLLVAITLTPVSCSLLLTREKDLRKQKEGSWVERNLKRLYRSSLQRALRLNKWIIGIAVFLFTASVFVFFTFGRDFLPPFNEGSMTVNVITVPGISLDESKKIGKKAEHLLLSLPEIEKVGRRTGRGELAEHTFGVNVSEIDVPFTLDERSRDEFLAEVRHILSDLPGVSIEVGAPITHRINHMLSGSQAGIAIKIFGTDLSLLYKIGSKIKDEIALVEGIGDLTIEPQVEVPQIRIIPNRTMLAKYGIHINEIHEFISNAFAGVKVSDVFEDEKAFDLVLRFRDEDRNNMNAIRNALIDTHDGKKIPLYYVADIQSSSGPNTISRENVQRKLVVSVNSAGRDLGSLIEDIRGIVDDKISLPENYRIEYGGQFKSAASATRILTITSLMAIFVIFILLFQEFKNSQLAGIILLNLPLSLIGGVAAILLTTRVVSIPGIIGFITLFGIATRNGILLISRYQSLIGQGKSVSETVIQGSIDRLSPILMTALTAALSLLPLAISGDKSGNEIQSPMAIVILGGLLSSTLLNIYVVPVVYSIIQTKKAKNEED
jgi:Cu/Ag efflux pump CusA